MRNKMKFIGIAMILVVVALGYSKSRQPENLDTLLLDNVEALAAGEAADGGDCIGSGSIVCPFNNTEVAHVLVYYSLPSLACSLFRFLLAGKKCRRQMSLMWTFRELLN